MLRVVMIVVVAAAILVALRIVRLSFRAATLKNERNVQDQGQVIEMPARERSPLIIHEVGFANFSEDAAPKDSEEFFERMFVKIGRAGEPETQMYSLHLTTPKGLQRALQSETFRFGRDLLVVERFDRELIRSALEKHLYELPQLARQIE